jgi:two-component system sensor histidine kinase VanS
LIKNVLKYLKYILIPFIIVIAFYMLFRAIDIFSAGAVADWFDRMFIYERSYSDDGVIYVVRNVNWGALKVYIIETLLIITMIGSWIMVVFLNIRKRKERRKNSRIISEYLYRFLIEDEAMPLEIPEEDSEVFARISEIKLEMNSKETALQKEMSRKNDMVTYLAHDLKTPLTSVIGYLSILEDEPGLPPEQRKKYIDVALRKAVRLEELEEQLFEICRFNLTEIEIEAGDVNLSKMLEQITYEFAPLLREKNLTICTKISSDVHYSCDVDKIERVFDNLIRNAINYSYPESEINVSLDGDDKFVNIIIENRGRTIPSDKLERIFEQFYRVDSSRNSSSGGSGLGLAIAKQLVEAHGGVVAAESENEMIRFVVKLPREKIV